MKLTNNDMERLKILLISDSLNIMDFIISTTGVSEQNVYNVMFSFINHELDNYDLVSDIDYLFTAVKYLEKSIINYKTVNVKKIIPKLAKVYERITNIIEEHKKVLSVDILNKFQELSRNITSISFNIANSNGGKYDFLNYLITKYRNLNVVGKVLDQISVSLCNEDGVSLFGNLINEYLSAFDSDQYKNDVLYFGNVIRLIVNKNRDSIKDENKRKWLNTIYLYIDRLSSKDKMYSIKLENCKSLVEFFKGEVLEDALFASLLNQYNISSSYDDMLEEAVVNKCNNVLPDSCDREVVRDFVLSIDGVNAREIDDCLSCVVLPNSNYLLGVHIADVLGYLPYSSYIIKEALKRGSTIYLSDNYIPLLPNNFVDRATLCEGENRFAISHYFEITQSGEIVDKKIKKSIICNNKQLSYSSANSILANEVSCNFALKDTLSNLSRVSSIISDKYKGKNLYLILKDDRPNVSLNIVGNSPSERIVSNAMILTNNSVADYFYYNGFPFIYRTHFLNIDKQEEVINLASQLMDELTNSDFEKIFSAIREHYPKASYGVCGSHEGLNLKHYTHVTSPLRRAADIVGIECLNRCYFNNPSYEDVVALKNELAKVIPDINEINNTIEMFAWDYEKSKKYKSSKKRTYQKKK